MSRLPFEMFLALRYLRPKRTFVSIITLISIVGVMLGVAVLIIVISVMSGFDKKLRDSLLGFTPHLLIQKRVPGMNQFEPMTNPVDLMRIVSTNPLVRGVTPYVVGPVLAKTLPEKGAPQVLAPTIRGIDPKIESHISVLPSSIVQGTFDVSGNGLLVGRDLANAYDLNVGDRLAIYSIRDLQRMEESWKASRTNQNSEEIYTGDEYEIRGIFDVGYFEFDYRMIVCSLGNAQDLYGLGNAVEGLMVMLNDPSKANQLRAELQSELGPNVIMTTWEQQYSEILDALLVEKNVMFYLLFFITIVAAFGITSALITFVVQKTREIGVLKAIGATNSQIRWIFLSQSLFVGTVGVLAGFGLGLLAVTYRNEFLFFLRRVTGFQLFPARIYNFRELPAVIDFGDIAIICGGSLIICLLAGWFPAWNAGRLKPVEALHHE